LFDFIGQWPEASRAVRLKKPSMRGIGYRLVKRPFQNYLVFYRVGRGHVVIGSVLWGGTNWQEDLKVF